MPDMSYGDDSEYTNLLEAREMQQQAEEEGRRQEEEDAAYQARVDHYYANPPEPYDRRDWQRRHDSRSDMATDGRPLMVGNGNGGVPFAEWCKDKELK